MFEKFENLVKYTIIGFKFNEQREAYGTYMELNNQTLEILDMRRWW